MPACRRARACARVCASVRVCARVRVRLRVCVCVCARAYAWACVNFYIAGSGAEKPGFVAVNRGSGYGARMKKFIVNAGKVADLGLKLKLCDFEEGKDYVFKRKHNGMKVLWNKDLIAKLVSGEPIEADTEETVETKGMIPKQISVSSHKEECLQVIETEDHIRDATEMVEIELPESENSISQNETDTELTWIDAPKIKECENSISKVEIPTKTVEISSKLVEIASEISPEETYTARVKKLFPNHRFVLLESNVMVASGKLAGRLRPGNTVFVRNGTVIRG